MNTAYFTTVITELGNIETELTAYSTYVNRVLAQGGMSCAQLSQLATNAALRIAKANSQLNSLSTNSQNMISTLESNIAAAQAALAPLLTPPTDLSQALTWISNAIAIFSGPYAAYTAQLAVLATQLSDILAQVSSVTSAIATLTSTINNAIAAAQTAQGCI
jgi:prefoldin subunit 5